jgi:ribosomal-protein-alanine N-acetyltransferase
MATIHTLIEQAEVADARSIRELAIDANIDAWSESGYVDEISRTGSFVLRAVRSGRLVGFLVARIVPGKAEHPDADLYNIAVDREAKREGIGSQLLDDLVARLLTLDVENLWLEVRESNLTAIGFYEKHGFEADTRRPNFYSNPVEDAVIMRLRLRRNGGVSEV